MAPTLISKNLRVTPMFAFSRNMALISVGHLLSPRPLQWGRPVRVKRKHVEDMEAVAIRGWAPR